MRPGLAAVLVALLSLSFAGEHDGADARTSADARAVAEAAARWILDDTDDSSLLIERRFTVLREQLVLNRFRRHGPLRTVADCRKAGSCFALPVVARPEESTRLEGDVFIVVRQRGGRLVAERGWYAGEALVCDAGYEPVRRPAGYLCVPFKAY